MTPTRCDVCWRIAEHDAELRGGTAEEWYSTRHSTAHAEPAPTPMMPIRMAELLQGPDGRRGSAR